MRFGCGLHRDLDRLFTNPNYASGDDSQSAVVDWVPAVDIREEDREFVLHADLPGIDAKLRSLQQPALGLRFSEDWLVPANSMSDLLGRIGSTAHESSCLDEAALGARPDHFRWMRQPDAVADAAVAWLARHFP